LGFDEVPNIGFVISFEKSTDKDLREIMRDRGEELEYIIELSTLATE
jgi:hypothetical protein